MGIALARREEQQSPACAPGAQASAGGAVEAQNLLLATASHEMRGMLNGITGMAQLLLLSEITPGQRRQVEVIAESGRSLEKLLADLLDLSRLGAGHLRLRPEPASLPALIEQVRTRFATAAAGKGITLAVEIAAGTPDRLVFDSERLGQCVANLVANAVKFTERGQVRISARIAPRFTDGHRLEIAVSDSGIGIAPEHHQRLFQPFSQAEDSIARRFGGSGLGLCITRQIVEAMGGSVGFTSRPGEGSTFWLDIPVGDATGA